MTRTIFVFGSNRQGRHGMGAALHARTFHGAIYGQAEGLQGDSYAIVTKELRYRTHPPVTLSEVQAQVEKFLQFIQQHPEHDYIISRVGCGLAGFKDEQIAPLFEPLRLHPSVIRFPKEWNRTTTLKGE